MGQISVVYIRVKIKCMETCFILLELLPGAKKLIIMETH